eukprot:Gb_14422 [translate_table: standard]
MDRSSTRKKNLHWSSPAKILFPIQSPPIPLPLLFSPHSYWGTGTTRHAHKKESEDAPSPLRMLAFLHDHSRFFFPIPSIHSFMRAGLKAGSTRAIAPVFLNTQPHPLPFNPNSCHLGCSSIRRSGPFIERLPVFGDLLVASRRTFGPFFEGCMSCSMAHS